LIRPVVSEFIASISTTFDVLFFTASAPESANRVIDAIAPQTSIEHRFFGESCVISCGYSVKDLRLLERPLGRVLIVDGIDGSALLQPENLIRISAWNGTDGSDAVLLPEFLAVVASIAHEPNLPSTFRTRALERHHAHLFASGISARPTFRTDSECIFEIG
jgi:import inner membrane translocase subunit TIM50